MVGYVLLATVIFKIAIEGDEGDDMRRYDNQLSGMMKLDLL